MSARGEELQAAAGPGEDTSDGSQPPRATSTRATAMLTPSGEILADEVLARLRTAGLALPRAPHPGREWTPRTEAERHLFREACRLDKVRRMLLEDIARRAQQDARLRRVFAARAPRPEERGAAGACPVPPHELEALAAAAAGETLEQMSARLILSYDTIRTRRRRALQRLGVHSVTQAVALLVDGGWITGQQIAGGASC